MRLGRNDPCWCGSGRKLKKCHGTAKRYPADTRAIGIPPSSRPIPTLTHLEGGPGHWVERPGIFKARLGLIAASDLDQELADAHAKWGRLLKDCSLPIGVSQPLTQRLSDIEHKLQGVRYHLDNYTKHEQEIEQQISASPPPTGAEVQLKQPRLVFEVEAFLYQTKSALDMLTQLLHCAGFHSMGESFGDHGERIITQLDKSAPVSCKGYTQLLISLIQRAQSEWIDETVTLRDFIAHKGMLTDIGSFVQHPYMGGENAALTYPMVRSGQRTRYYLMGVEQKLRSFVGRFIELSLSCTSALKSPGTSAE